MLEPPLDVEETTYDRWIIDSILLYNRCIIFGNEISFPSEGGLLEQDELILRILETIHEEIGKFKSKKIADEEFKVKHSRNVSSGRTTFRR